jgi:hypothetical protein
MAALTLNTDRRLSGGDQRNLPSQASAVPFEGSLLGINATGYVGALTAGQPFAGVCELGIIARDAASAAGSRYIRARSGLFTAVFAIAGVTRADVTARRRVYASSDNDLSLTAEAGNTYIGDVVDLYTQLGGVTNGVVVQCRTIDQQMYGAGIDGGVGAETLADAAATLTISQLDKLLYIPNTAARTLTLPAAASCTGRSFSILKTTAASFAFTLQGNAAENINGANTAASGTAQYSQMTVRSDGSQWFVTSKI